LSYGTAWPGSLGSGFFTAEAGVRSQAILFEICGRRIGTGAGVSSSFFGFSCRLMQRQFIKSTTTFFHTYFPIPYSIIILAFDIICDTDNIVKETIGSGFEVLRAVTLKNSILGGFDAV
jgi:hypothetical protein